MNTDRRIPNIVIFVLLLLLVSASTWAAQRTLEGDEENGYYVTLPVYGPDTLLIPAEVTSFKLYDDGGPDGKASGYGVIVLKSLNESEGSVLMVSGIMKKSRNDLLEIYDGESRESDTIFSRYGTTYGADFNIGYVLGSGKSLTVYSQNYQSNFDGFDFTVSLVDPAAIFDIENEEVDGGTVSCTNASVAGQPITLEINADDGFLLKSIDVVDETGYHVPLKGRWHLRKQSTLTFTMPYSKVQVIPVFTDDLTAEGGLYLDMQVSGTETVDIPAGVTSFKVYDNGGGSANPSSGGDSKLVLNALNVPDGYVLKVSGSIYTDDSGKLFVLDGDAEGDVMFEGSSYMSTIGYVTSTGKTMTLNTKLGTYSFYYFGVNLTVEVVDGAVEHTIENEPVDGGTVTCTNASVAGQPITLEINADDGFLLKSIEVIDESNYRLSLEGEWRLFEQSTLTFKMPYSKVRIVPVFTDNLTAEGGLYVNMPFSGTKAVAVPAGVKSFKVYDDGGANGKRTYKADGEMVITFMEIPDNHVLQVTGNLITEDPGYDELYIYDGYSKDGKTLLNRFTRNGNIGRLFSSGRMVSVKYKAVYGLPEEGIDLTMALVDLDAPHTVTAEAATGGSVSIRNNEASKGTTVTFDVSHEDGYLLNGIDVVDEEGNHLPISGNWELIDNPELSFVMPYSNVKIYPTFGDDLTASSLSINMPVSGTKTIDVSAGVQSLKLYDNGGPGSSPASGHSTVVLNSLKESDDYVWIVKGNTKGYNSDSIVIYNGTDLNGSRILNVAGEISYFSGISTGKAITIDVNNYLYHNFELTLSLVDASISHPITVEQMDGGTVMCSKETATARTTVTLAIAADDGYLLKGIDVFDSAGNRIDLKGEWQMQKNSMLSFTMPYSDVRVVPTFTNDLTAEGGLYAYMPATGTKTLNVPAGVSSFKVYSEGGRYTPGSDGVLVISASEAPTGNVIAVEGSVSLYENDTLSVYDGGNVTSAKLCDYSGYASTVEEKLFSSGNAIAIALKSQGSGGYKGADLKVSIVDLRIAHRVNIAAGTGGSVTSRYESYDKDAIVTLDVVAENGYMLNGIKAVDADGRLRELKGAKYMTTSSTVSFVMPYADVEVVAEFTDEFTAEGGLHVDMGRSGRETLSVPSNVESFKLYDAGGASGTCLGSLDTLTLVAPNGYVFEVSGSIKLGFKNDSKWVKIFDGYAEDRVLLDMHGENYSFNKMLTSDNALSLVMNVDGDCYTSDLDFTVKLLNQVDFRKVICESAEGGTVVSDRTSALEGDIVHLEITPEKGKYLKDVVVADADGNTVARYAWYSGNEVSFEMPSSDVTVTPIFTDDVSDFSVNMPGGGTAVAYIPEGVNTFKLYDDGGPSYIYGSYLDGNLVLIAPEGKILQISGNIEVYSSGLFFYDGNILGREVYHNQQYEFSGNIGTHVNTTNVMTIWFKTSYNSTNMYYDYYGLDLTVEVVDPAEKYGIAIAEAVRGAVVSDKQSARAGETITLTGRPDKDGSVLVGVRAVDGKQNSLPVTRTSDTTYTFVMPASAVSVTSTFANPTVVSFDENGCLNNGTYFHLENVYIGNDGYYWYLSQDTVEYPNVGRTDFTCWKDVYDTLELTDYKRSHRIFLKSDLDLGGYDEETSKCAMAFRPIGNSHSEINGNGYVIKNFCHDSSFAGFVTKDYGGTLRNLVFENADVRGDTAGVVGATFAGAFDSVVVRNSKVSGVYAGGAVGIVKNNVGRILVSDVEVTASGNCDDSPCEAYLGGVAGLMQIDDASIQNARVQNVSIKRADDSFDVYAGGLVGVLALNYDMGRAIDVSRDTVTGISFTSCAYAGGLFGKMNLNPVKWTGITASVSESYVQGSVTALSYAGGLVGYVSEGTQENPMSFGIAKSSARADVSVTGSNSYAGGLLGYFENVDSDSNIVLNIKGTSSIGNVTGSQGSTLGYLIGGMSDSSKFTFEAVRGNFHFGTNDAQAYKGIGSFSDEGWNTPELGEHVSVNIRNAISGLTADGTLAYNVAPVHVSGGFRYNGILSENDMKSPKFAATLNWTDAENGGALWSIAGSGKNDGLPFIASGIYHAIYAVGFDKESLERLASADKKQALEEALAANTYTEESCGEECSAVMLYTNYSGHLDDDDLNFMQNLLDGNAYWFGAQELGKNTVYANAPAPYVYEKSMELNVVYHICAGSISNNVCNGTEYEIKDGMDIEGFENIGFLLSPVKKFISNDYRIAIPPMFKRTDTSLVGIYMPSAYRLNGKLSDVDPAVGSTSAELFRDLFVEIAEYDFENYSDTVHLVYDMNGSGSMDALHLASDMPYSVQCVGYDVAGSWGAEIAWFALSYTYMQNYDEYVTLPPEGVSPLAAGFKVAIDRIPGYSDKYSVEFGLKNFDGKPDTLAASGNYIATTDDFANKYRSAVWRKENLTADEVVRMDSVYTSLIAFGLSSDDFVMKIVPQPNEYVVTFDVRLPVGVDTTSVFFGQGWDSEKPLTKTLSVGDPLPQLYLAWYVNCHDHAGWSLVAPDTLEKYGSFGEDFYGALAPEHIPYNVEAGGAFSLVPVFQSPYCAEHYGEWYMYFYAVKTNEAGEDETSYDVHDIHGTVVLSQKVAGTVFEHPFIIKSDTSRLDVPPLSKFTDSDYLEFKVSVRPDVGYEMRNLRFRSIYENDNPEDFEGVQLGLMIDGADSILRVGPRNLDAASLYANFVPKTYTVSFRFEPLKNGVVVLSDNWKSTTAQLDVVEKSDFPKAYFLGDDGFSIARWRGDTLAARSFNYFNTDIIADALGGKADNGKLTLYAATSSGAGRIYETRDLFVRAVNGDNKILGGYSDHHGSLVLSQTFDTLVFSQEAEFTLLGDDEYAYRFRMPDATMNDTLTFDVSTKPDPGYKVSIVSFDDGWQGKPSSGDFGYNAKKQKLKYVPSKMYSGEGFKIKYELLDYNVVFTRPTVVAPVDGKNAVDYFVANSVYGGKWSDAPQGYTVESENRQTPTLYAVGGCIGWSKSRKADSVFYEFDNVAAASLNLSDTVFATFRAQDDEICYGALSKTVTVHSDKHGTLELWQFIGQGADADTVRHTFTLDKEASSGNDMVYTLEVPSYDIGTESDISMTFEVRAVPENSGKYYVDAKESYYFSKDSGNAVMHEFVNGAAITTGTAELEFHLKFALAEATLAFDVGNDSLFYGSDWKEDGDFATKDSSSSAFPVILYSNEKCLAGWSLDSSSGAMFTVLNAALLDSLYRRNLGSEAAQMYARWTDDVSECAGDFLKLSIEQENGAVRFQEEGRAHEFVDGSMILPQQRAAALRVKSKPDSSYVLDSLVIYYGREVYEKYGYEAFGSDALELPRVVLFEGDELPENLEWATLVAYFGKANKTKLEFVRSEFLQSGFAVSMDFAASDFEVTRAVKAEARIYDVDGEVVARVSLGDSVNSGFETTAVLRVEKPGEYRAVVSLFDAKETAEFESSFEVKPEIATVTKDGWQMVSLATLDTSALVWDGDQIFYWWDEGNTGEFWYYQQFNRGDSIYDTRGFWYNSLQGRPLVMLPDFEDSEDDFVWNLESENSGWNLVANPHSWGVDLFSLNADARVDVDEEAEVVFWRYNDSISDYEEVDYVEPFGAVWASAKNPKKWKMSAAPAFQKPKSEEPADSLGADSLVMTKRILAKAHSRERWTLQLSLSDANGKRDAWNLLGVGNRPFVAEEPPASPGDHVNLSIVEGRRALAKSIRSADDELEWTVSLSATSDRVGYLAFAGIDDVRAYGYHVYVTVDGSTTEILDSTPLKVYLTSNSKSASVRVSESRSVVAKNSLGGLRSVRLGNRLQVNFVASEGLAGSDAVVDLLDMKGRVLATVSVAAVHGDNAVMLDVPGTGLYMLRVRAGSARQVGKVWVR